MKENLRMISTESVQSIIGGTAYGTNGEKIGSIGTVYLDNQTGQPAWVTVKTGFFGSNESFVPLEQAEQTNDGIRVPYDKDRVKNAPNIETDRELSEQEEDQLYSYYGLGGGTTAQTTGTTGVGTGAGTTERADRDRDGVFDDVEGRTVGHDTSGPTTDDAMTRSEERVRAGTEKVEAGRARLRKYVTTEQQQVSVPTSREEVRVEREPITDANYDKAMDGAALSEEEHEVVLTEERPVVTTEAVPVERVRLGKDQVQDEQTVTADVRKEVIDTDVDGGTTTGRTTTGNTGDNPSIGDKARGLADKARDKLS
jgi:uncharacterized protein (TIGR02271 family)